MIGLSSDRRTSVGVTDDPGPVDDGVNCAACPLTDANEAAYRLPDPRFSVATVSALCTYHLAVVKREHPDRWATIRSHPEIDGLEAATADHALVELGDVAAEIEVDGEDYQRVGLDELGTAYFVRDVRPYYRVVETNEHYDVLNGARVELAGGLARLFDHIERRVGWRALESEWANRARAEDGGESA